MAERMHVLMACSRPDRIPVLSPHYLKPTPHPFELRWHILQQGPEPDPKGIYKVNEMLGLIRDGWLMTVADDTIQSPDLFKRIGEVIEENPHAGAIIFQLKWRGFTVPSTRRIAETGGVGCAQAVWKREFIGDKRFDWDTHGIWCDTKFVIDMVKEHPDRFVFVEEPLMTFNSME